MDITIRNCGNIDSGKIEIKDGALNVKYAINGTGKTTVSSAIKAFVEDNTDMKNRLTPFKHIGETLTEANAQAVDGIENIKKISVFNEEYIRQYMFDKDVILKDSFNVLVRTPDYDKHMEEIEALLTGINKTFQSHAELNELISVFQGFIDGCGKAKNGYSKSGAIAKGIGNGNKIEHIPETLKSYAPYLKHNEGGLNAKWIGWQLGGKKYFDIDNNQCPYCTASIETTRDTILEVEKQYKPKDIEHLNKMLAVFDTLMPYFSDETKGVINTIANSAMKISDSQIHYIAEVRQQVENLFGIMTKLKTTGFSSLKNVGKVADEIKNYRIDLSCYGHFNSPLMQEKVEVINFTLNELLDKAGKLQGEINIQKSAIKRP